MEESDPLDVHSLFEQSSVAEEHEKKKSSSPGKHYPVLNLPREAIWIIALDFLHPYWERRHCIAEQYVQGKCILK